MPRKSGIPTCRQRTIRGRKIAYVTLRDQRTGRRRDHALDEYGTPASRQKYARLIAEWEAHGRRLPLAGDTLASELTISQLCHADWAAVKRVPEQSTGGP